MSDVSKEFKINLNQNLWGVLVGLLGLGIAEYYELCTLFWFAVVISLIMAVSVAVTMFAYTVNYWKEKMR